MPEVGVLQCPVCKKKSLYDVDRVSDRETVKELAETHLKTHRLDESKQGIYRVAMANRLERVVVDDTTQAPLETWTASVEDVPVLE